MHQIKRSFLYALAYTTALVSSAVAQTTTFTSVSAGNWGPIVAPDSIAAGFGNAFAMTTTVANQISLPTTLANATVSITDSAGKVVAAPLFLVAAGQINYLLPADMALGKASVKVTVGSNSYQGPLEVATLAPAIFAADGSGTGPPAAQVLRVSGGVGSFDPPPFTLGVNGSAAAAATIKLTPFTDSLYLTLYATGIRRHSANPVKATIGGVSVPVIYAGPQGSFSGLDQINIGPLPQSLAGKGAVNLVVTVDGIPANTANLNVQ
jgi:uncharacterized protein (TIGR03437 family)